MSEAYPDLNLTVLESILSWAWTYAEAVFASVSSRLDSGWSTPPSNVYTPVVSKAIVSRRYFTNLERGAREECLSRWLVHSRLQGWARKAGGEIKSENQHEREDGHGKSE
jgi:hypothetical protein